MSNVCFDSHPSVRTYKMEGVLYSCMHALKACICRRILLFMWYVHVSMCCVHYVCICMSAWERLNIYISVSSNIYIYILKAFSSVQHILVDFTFSLPFVWIPNFFVEETKLGSLESFVARLGERQQGGCGVGGGETRLLGEEVVLQVRWERLYCWQPSF